MINGIPVVKAWTSRNGMQWTRSCRSSYSLYEKEYRLIHNTFRVFFSSSTECTQRPAVMYN